MNLYDYKNLFLRYLAMKPDLEIDLLRTFLAVAETNNFTQAAQRLHRVQSAVSTQIRKLEAVTGNLLFDRGRGRRVALTEAGEILAGYARRILALNEDALSDLGHAAIAGKVRLGTTDTYAYCYLPRLLSLFVQANPKVELEVCCQHSRLLLEALDKEQIDVALLTKQAQRSDGIIVRREPLVWTVARGYTVYEQTPLPVAFMPVGCAFRAAALPALDGIGRPWRMAFTSVSPSGVQAAVAAGLAVTVFPQGTLQPSLRRLGSEQGFPSLPTIDIVLHKRNGSLSRAVCKLIDDILLDLGTNMPP